jgi:hypothetical protein
MQAHRQSQQACSISQHFLSPLVQVMQQPSLVISHWQFAQHRLHWHISMPFQVQQQLHIPPASILHKFCIAPQAISSSQVQTIFIPPAHFSMLIVHRGTIIIEGMPIGVWGLIPGVVMPGIDIPRSIIIIALDIETLLFVWPGWRRPVRRAYCRGSSPGYPVERCQTNLWFDQSVSRLADEKPPVVGSAKGIAIWLAA